MLAVSVYFCRRFAHVTLIIALWPLELFFQASGARTNTQMLKALEVTSRANLHRDREREASAMRAESSMLTTPSFEVDATGASGNAYRTSNLEPLSLSFQIAIIAFVMVVSGNLLTRSEKTEKEDMASIDAYGREISEESSGLDLYRTLACLVCNWATCHLSFPVLLYSWQKAPLKSILATLPGEDSLPAATLQVAVIVGILCCMVGQYSNHSVSHLFCPMLASIACIGIEWLVLSPPSSAIVFSCPLGLLVGSGICMHMNAMCTAIQHAKNCWVLPLSLVMYAGVADGFIQLQSQHDSSSSSVGSTSAIVGLYSTWALKFASVGLMCSAQVALYASPLQQSLGRTTFGLREFLRKGESMVLSWRFFFAFLLQALPICLCTVLYGSLANAEAIAFYDRNPWENWAMYLSLGTWGIVFPAWVTYCFPASHQCLITCTCMAMLGALAVLHLQLIGRIELGSPWGTLMSAISLALAASAAVAEIALQDDATRSIKHRLDRPVDFFCCHKEVASRVGGDPQWQGSSETLGNEPIFASFWLDPSLIDEKESFKEENQKPHVFEDPLAALFAPDVYDDDN